MRQGLYESLINGRLGDELDRLIDLTASTGPVDEADAPHVLARYVGELLEARLRAIRDPDERLRTVNQLVTQLAGPPDAIAAPVRQLLSIEGPAGPGNVNVSSRPRTPLSDAALLTNASDEPSLGAELRAEIDTADEVDLLCAFVKWHGLRLLEPELERARERNVPLRVITTTYIGATEREALDRLVRDFGAEVQDPVRRRSAPGCTPRPGCSGATTGFDTAYVGSSNLSRAAPCSTASSGTSGCPGSARRRCWRSSRRPSTPTGTTSEFETYDPDRDRDRLDDALAEASGRTARMTGSRSRSPASRCGPFPTSRRCSTRSTSSGPFTTGTATWSSPRPAPARPSSRRWTTDDSVQADGRRGRRCCSSRTDARSSSSRCAPTVRCSPTRDFGELYVGGARPERWRHVFASVQSLHVVRRRQHPGGRLRRSSSSTSSTTPRRATYRRILDHLDARASCSG